MTHDAPDLSRFPRSRVLRGKYGRMFQGLPPFDPPSQLTLQAPMLGRAGLEAAVMEIAREIRRDDGGVEGDNRTIPAGFTYLGQLIAHDLTFDPSSIQARSSDPERLNNFRTPRLDLDCVYGRGPLVDPMLYQQTELGAEDRALAGFLLREGKALQIGDGLNPGEPDLPRSSTPVVWSADPPYVWMNSLEEVDLADSLRGAVKTKAAKKKVRAALKKLGWAGKKRGSSALPRRLYEARRVRYVADASTIMPFESGAWVRLVDRSKLRATKDGEDVVRLHPVPESDVHALGGTALVADPRNDDNVLVSQLHLALVRFHNSILRRLRDERPDTPGDRLFLEARRMTCWHYQWIVVHHYLPKVVGSSELDRAHSGHLGAGQGASPFRWKNQPFLPIEFTAGAFRFGHAMIRDSYHLNDALRRRRPFSIRADTDDRSSDLRGDRLLPPRWTLQWDRFLDVGYESRFQASRKITPSLAAPLMDMGRALGSPSLAELDLLRGWRLGLPSGQAVARYLGFDPLLSAVRGRHEDPLWLYVLREGEEQEGERLGPVGGTIVAEVILGLLAGDPSSYLGSHRRWTPREGGVVDSDDFDLVDLIRAAGLPVTAEEHLNLIRVT